MVITLLLSGLQKKRNGKLRCCISAREIHVFFFSRFKFDDDRVTPATLKEVLEDNYGGEALNTHPKLRNMKRSTNAYMLVYIRESMQDEILREVTINDIPEHLGTYELVQNQSILFILL